MFMKLGSIQKTSTSVSITNISSLIYLSIDQKTPDTYTEIGKNGMVVFDGVNSFTINNNDGIVMKSMKSPDEGNEFAVTNILGNGFYGIKVSPDGIFFCNGTRTWKKWDPS